jgi:hypothetical protein
MTERNPDDVTLSTLHEDLTAGFADLKGEMHTGFADLKGEMRAGFADLKDEMRTGFADLKGEMRAEFADLKITLIVGFRSLPTRESSDEMIRQLREGNRLNEERFTRLDASIREQHFETRQVLHALVEGQRELVEGQRLLVEGQRSLSADIKAFIAALIRRRDNGEPAT